MITNPIVDKFNQAVRTDQNGIFLAFEHKRLSLELTIINNVNNDVKVYEAMVDKDSILLDNAISLLDTMRDNYVDSLDNNIIVNITRMYRLNIAKNGEVEFDSATLKL